jgi:hypothetical protein
MADRGDSADRGGPDVKGEVEVERALGDIPDRKGFRAAKANSAIAARMVTEAR